MYVAMSDHRERMEEGDRGTGAFRLQTGRIGFLASTVVSHSCRPENESTLQDYNSFWNGRRVDIPGKATGLFAMLWAVWIFL